MTKKFIVLWDNGGGAAIPQTKNGGSGGGSVQNALGPGYGTDNKGF